MAKKKGQQKFLASKWKFVG